jgi:hypothetical protein
MRSSLLHKCWLLIVMLAGISSLASGQANGYNPGQGYTLSVFDTSFEKALFKGTFDISKHHLSGLFFIKRISQDDVRIMFSNELGMTFFDLELKGNEFIIHSCFPSLNKAALMKILEADLRLLLKPLTKITRMKPEKSADPDQVVYSVRSDKGSYSYTWDKISGRICRIRTSHAFMGKTDLLLEGDEGLQPKKIHLANPTIKLHIRMTLLSK